MYRAFTPAAVPLGVSCGTAGVVGAQFTCFTSTKLQILTPVSLPAPPLGVSPVFGMPPPPCARERRLRIYRRCKFLYVCTSKPSKGVSIGILDDASSVCS